MRLPRVTSLSSNCGVSAPSTFTYTTERFPDHKTAVRGTVNPSALDFLEVWILAVTNISGLSFPFELVISALTEAARVLAFKSGSIKEILALKFSSGMPATEKLNSFPVESSGRSVS